jgi:hypothetical protein
MKAVSLLIFLCFLFNACESSNINKQYLDSIKADSIKDVKFIDSLSLDKHALNFDYIKHIRYSIDFSPFVNKRLFAINYRVEDIQDSVLILHRRGFRLILNINKDTLERRSLENKEKPILIFKITSIEKLPLGTNTNIRFNLNGDLLQDK